MYRAKKIWMANYFCDCPRISGRKMHIVNDEGHKCSAFGNHPLTRDLYDCNGTHYMIQLNIYRWLLKKFYGITAVRLVLVVLHPNQDDGYIRIELPIREDIVHGLMKERYYELHPDKRPDLVTS